ncbi:MAG: flagellar basal body-associated FliL family protein [Proteobacteria bacterium]|nr:flagellar basal body-associated FliL family protein [Pseudomonadota bacterium]
MAKDDDAGDIEKSGEDAAPEGEAAPKQGFVKKLLGNKKMLIIAAAAALLVVGGGGAGAFFLLGGSKDAKGVKTVDGKPVPPPIVAPQVAFYDMPDIVVNIQSADGNPAYLKLGVALELTGPDEKAGIQPLMPRVVDQFQGYLRELRVDDLKGSAGVLRLKEELLRRINVATAPFAVKDVLLKEMIVQ